MTASLAKHPKALTLADLGRLEVVRLPLYNDGGGLIFEPGDHVAPEDIALLQELGLERFVQPQSDEERRRFLREVKQHKLDVESLQEGQALAYPLHDERGDLLIGEGAVVTRATKDRLIARNVLDVFVQRSPGERGLDRAARFRERYEAKAQTAHWDAQTDIAPAERISDPQAITAAAVDAQLERGLAVVKPEGQPLAALIRERPYRQRAAQDKAAVLAAHRRGQEGAAALFGALRRNQGVQAEAIGDLGKGVIESLVRDRPLLLNMLNAPDGEDWLVDHAVRTTSLACSIAAQIGYSQRQVLEVAYCTLLADVGMYRVPTEVLRKREPLSALERLEIEKHPAHTLNMLQRAYGIPVLTPLVCYQVHERLDRSGYPKGRPGHLIHPYAQIVALTDVYDALTHERPHRPALLPNLAMEAIVRGVAQRKFDPSLVRALLAHLGMFPVGSLVELEGPRYAKVVQAHPEAFTRPVLGIFHQNGAFLDPPEPLDLQEVQWETITRPLSVYDLAPLGLPNDFLLACF